MTETTKTEYGVRFADRPRFFEGYWPNEKGTVPLAGSSAYQVDATDLAALHAAAAEHNASGRWRRMEVVSRTITTTVTVSEPVVVKPPVKLPTAYGSIVKATVEDGETRLLVLADDDSLPWRTVGPDGGYHSVDDLSDVQLVFDAAGVTL